MRELCLFLCRFEELCVNCLKGRVFGRALEMRELSDSYAIGCSFFFARGTISCFSCAIILWNVQRYF